MAKSDLRPGFGLAFEDLHERDGLIRLDGHFRDQLRSGDAALADRLEAARAAPDSLSAKDESQLLIDLAPNLEVFVARLFGIEAEVAALRQAHADLAPLYSCKRLFVQRRAAKGLPESEIQGLDADALAATLSERGAPPADELAFAARVNGWLAAEADHAESLQLAARYAAWAVHSAAGKAKHHHGLLFKVPEKLDMERLVPVQTDSALGAARHRLPEALHRHRDGFKLTDAGTDLAGALDQANYCIFCHNQGKDSCSKGLRDKPVKAADGTTTPGAFKKTVFGVTLAGCPLEEKISEMHQVKTEGWALGALGIICVDNPLAAGTGHRICNDCMKSCIYQKQEPVNIPQAETRILKDVLALPWGFEIYALLTRWNPLDLRRPYPKAPTGRRVLVAGLGPAGMTLSHHLVNDGHAVYAIDGLKIEPLPAAISGVDLAGLPAPFRPIHDVRELYESLDDRVMAGFGGVAEYGITVRWDKNFLKILRLLLERRRAFSITGGVRFGGTVTVDDAWAMGFDHIALCLGAGKPTILDIPNRLARGVRTASDFLMALQLTGAAKASSIANMQLRLPIVVIGGGLTAIDTATESLSYYIVQVEKFLRRYEILAAERGEGAVRAGWNEEEIGIAEEFLAHGRALREERRLAAAERRDPKLAALVQSWGGVTLAYRKRMIDSPSYTLNHEEVLKGLEEGISFAECLDPVGVEIDRFGHASGLRMQPLAHQPDGKFTPRGETIVLPARAVLIAAGTQPNTVLAREDPTHFALDGRYFQAVDEQGAKVKPERLVKPSATFVLLSLDEAGRGISYFGDLHPSFSGNVVKAFGGAKRGYPVVSRVLAKRDPASNETEAAFRARFAGLLRPTVHEVKRLTPTIIEVIVKAPQQAKRFLPGQFYRLQNFESLAPRLDGTILGMEGLALTGAWVDAGKGLVSTIALEMGGSSDLGLMLKPGESVVLMGPTGTPTETPGGETALLVGGGLGNAVLFSIGQALRAAGSKVLYFAGYKKVIDRYKVAEIEQAADVVIWCCDEAPGFVPTRPQDRTFVGNIVQAMLAYTTGQLGEAPIELAGVDRIIAIGSDRMMAAVAQARHGVLQPYLNAHHHAVGSINSPMQCMMKEICAQCLQTHRDPATGKETVVFSCFNQDQPLDHVDWPVLNQRLRQNSLQEKLTAQWIDRTLRGLAMRPAAA